MNEEVETWDYRLVRRYYEPYKAEQVYTTWISLTEVYFSRENKPLSFVIDPELPTWEEGDQLEKSKEECAAAFAKMMLAWELPILDELKDFSHLNSDDCKAEE